LQGDFSMAVIKNFDKVTKTLIMEFMSVGDLVKFINENPTNECFEGKNLQSMSRKQSSFNSTESLDETLNFLEYGWTAESEKLTQKLNLAKQNQPHTARRKVFQSVVGYTPIVPNYLQGIPTDMLNSKMMSVTQRVVTINKDISYSAFYTNEKIEENSIKAYQIVQSLEAQGIRCNLNVISATECSYCVNVKKIIFKTRIKNSSERLNISKTSFPLVNPDMLRRVDFRLFETIPELKKEDNRITYGYGAPMSSFDVQCLVEKDKQYYLNRDISDPKETAKILCQRSNG
jgi:hypothetical protein